MNGVEWTAVIFIRLVFKYRGWLVDLGTGFFMLLKELCYKRVRTVVIFIRSVFKYCMVGWLVDLGIGLMLLKELMLRGVGL